MDSIGHLTHDFNKYSIHLQHTMAHNEIHMSMKISSVDKPQHSMLKNINDSTVNNMSPIWYLCIVKWMQTDLSATITISPTTVYLSLHDKSKFHTEHISYHDFLYEEQS